MRQQIKRKKLHNATAYIAHYLSLDNVVGCTQFIIRHVAFPIATVKSHVYTREPTEDHLPASKLSLGNEGKFCVRQFGL